MFNFGEDFKIWYGIIVINIGAFIFSYHLLKMLYLIIEELKKNH